MKIKKSLACVLTLIMALGIFTGTVSAKEDKKDELKFGEDGKFTVLHITDIQDKYPINSVAEKYLIDTVDKVNPDLIVLGGDNFAGNLVRTKNYAKKAINEYMSIFEERGIKVAAVFGNHDAENDCATKQDQVEMYQSYSCYVGTTGYTDGERVGTYNLPILSSDGKGYAFNLWLIDSGAYNDENDIGGYAAVKKDQIEWYKETEAKLRKENGGKAVPSIVFQHIIVPEIYDALKEVEKGTEGAIEKYDGKTEQSKYYVLPDGAKGDYSEGACPPDFNNGQFDAMLQTGDVIAMAFGHDHRNSFEIPYKGIDLINTPSMSFSLASYNGTLRGTRVFVLDENDAENYETYIVDYDDIYTEDNTMMKCGFAAHDRDNKLSSRIVNWFGYQSLKLASIIRNSLKVIF